MPTLEEVLRDAQTLPPGDQRLLGELLEAPGSIDEIAAEQGVIPFDLEAVQQESAFWPDDESADDFIATLRQWRQEDSERTTR